MFECIHHKVTFNVLIGNVITKKKSKASKIFIIKTNVNIFDLNEQGTILFVCSQNLTLKKFAKFNFSSSGRRIIIITYTKEYCYYASLHNGLT